MTDDVRGVTEVAGPETGVVAYVEQAGAICRRQEDGKTEFLLIRSLGRGRWGIPKGGIEAGESASEAAAREAFEEAGVSGRCHHARLGFFEYFKAGKSVPCRVSVHLLDVLETSSAYPEMDIRASRWTSREEALDLVDDDGLKRLFKHVG